ncbi:MAG: hypothetical protein KJ723_11520, partial [candidate division Zixibacteria bacterium]|nr:hypothetical protein [candidate division Zixibacteria bacterium]
LAMENLALRHQLNVLKRDVKRPRLKNRDRLLWVMLVRLWNDWRKPLILVQPETSQSSATNKMSRKGASLVLSLVTL